MTDIESQSMRGMADCMDMVRQELIEAGIIDAKTPPMFVSDAVVSAFQRLKLTTDAENEALQTELINVYEQLAQVKQWAGEQIMILEAKAKHWKSNHADQVERARILIERPDMPLERVNAYSLVCEVQEDAKRFAACRHAARTMPEDGGEDAFLIAIDKYREEHDL
jgi:hypothetical protein